MGQLTSIVFSMRSTSVLLASRLTSHRRCKLRSAGTRYALSVLADTRTFEDSNQCLSANGHSAAAAAEWHTFIAPGESMVQMQQLKELLLQSLEHERAG